MLDSIIGDTLPAQKCPPAQKPHHWFQSLIETFKRYKSEFFGAGDSEIRKQRMLDYTVKPTADFVLAKYRDGLYRPASISGRSKKKQLLIVCFFHTKKSLYVEPADIFYDHGNLLNVKVSFMKQGRHMKGKVYGNNSPANKGFPSMFYVKKKEKWHKVPVKMLFLTWKQFNKLKCDSQSEKKTDENKSDGNADDEIDTTTCCNFENHMEDLKEFDEDFEMS